MLYHRVKYLFWLLCLVLFGCGPARQSAPTIPPIPGWHMLENEGFQIWLPPSFLGGTNQTIDAVTLQLTQKDAKFAKIPQSLKQRGTPFIVFAIDTNSPPDKITYMLVENEKLTTSLDIPGYLDLLAKNLTAQSTLFNILQKEVVPSNRYPTGKIVVELNTLESGDIKQVVYAVKNGGAVWQISFTTPTEEFGGRSPTFDQIAASATVPYINETASPARAVNPWVIGLVIVAIAILGFLAGIWIKQGRKVEPTVQAKKIVRKKKAKKQS
jgi:hypothetical protein